MVKPDRLMNVKRSLLVGVWLGTLAGVISNQALARGGETENQHSLAISAGIASPSFTVNGPFENPVGFAFNSRTKAQISSSFSNLGDANGTTNLGGRLLFGDGQAGIGLGYNYLKRGENRTDHLFGFGGGAIFADNMVGFGVSGYYRATENSGSDTIADLSLAMMINPYGKYKFSFGAFGVGRGIDTLGFGFAAEASRQITFAIDAGVDDSFSGLTLKPGVGIHLMNVQLTASYGFELDSASGAQLPTGPTVGVAVWFAPSIVMQAYYEHIDEIFVGVTFRF